MINQRVRDLKANRYRERIKRLRIKHRTIAETVGVSLGHFHQIIGGHRPIEPYEKTINLIVTEYELAEKRIEHQKYG